MGTNLPQALLHSLNRIKQSTAHKKLVFCLTDGDLNGTPNIPDQLRYAKHHNTQIYCIGVPGSDPEDLKNEFGRDKVVYVEDIAELPRKIRQLTMKQI